MFQIYIKKINLKMKKVKKMFGLSAFISKIQGIAYKNCRSCCFFKDTKTKQLQKRKKK